MFRDVDCWNSKKKTKIKIEHNCYQLPLSPETFCRLRVFHKSSDCPTTAVVYIYEPTISNICFCNLCTRLYSAKTLPFGQSLRPCAPLPCPSSHLLADSTQTAALQMLKLLESRQREQLGHWSLYVGATPWSAAVLCGTVRVFSRWRCGTIFNQYIGVFRNSVSNNFHVEAVHTGHFLIYLTTCLPKRCLPRRSTSSVSDRLTLPHSITPTLTRGSTLTFDQRSKQKQANTQIIKNKSDGVVNNYFSRCSYYL